MEASRRSRRGILRAGLAGLAAIAAAALFRTAPAAAAKSATPLRLSRRGGATDALAKPPVAGVPGVSYFKAGDGHGPLLKRAGLAVYFNGRDVMNEAFEADLVGQWVGLYGPRVPGRIRARYYARGRVELRPAGGLGA